MEVSRQVQDGGSPRELGAPIGELLLERAASEPLPLPDGKIGILHRQLRQLRRIPSRECAITFAELVRKHAGRPPVEDDMVDHQDQDVLIGRQADKLGA